MAYTYQEYPKILYHHKKAPKGKRYESVEDEPKGWWARRGWVDTPAKFPRPSRIAAALRAIKPWWAEWKWIVGLLTALVVLFVEAIRLWRAF